MFKVETKTTKEELVKTYKITLRIYSNLIGKSVTFTTYSDTVEKAKQEGIAFCDENKISRDENYNIEVVSIEKCFINKQV